jgi:hypothetical protein
MAAAAAEYYRHNITVCFIPRPSVSARVSVCVSWVHRWSSALITTASFGFPAFVGMSVLYRTNLLLRLHTSKYSISFSVPWQIMIRKYTTQ